MAIDARTIWMPRGINPNGKYAKFTIPAMESAKAEGVTDKKEIRRRYNRAWMIAKAHATRKPQKPLSAAALAGRAAADKLKAQGVTDPKLLSGARSRSAKEFRRREAGAYQINRNSNAAIAGRSAVAALKEAGVTDPIQLKRAWASAYAMLSPNSRDNSPAAKERRNANCRKYYRRNVKYERKRSRIRRIKNPNYHTNYTNERRKRDPLFDVICRLRHSMNMRLGRFKGKDRTDDLLGCERGFFIKWLASKFKRGMTWANRSKWHIDHIFPCAACETIDDIKRSFFYRNLRPEWGGKNSAKTNRITHDGILCAFLCGISTVIVNRSWEMPDDVREMAALCGFKIVNTYAS